MDDPTREPSGLGGEEARTPPPPEPLTRAPIRPSWPALRFIFLNPQGLRAGWRLMAYIALALCILFVLGGLAHLLGVPVPRGVLDPRGTLAGESVLFISVFTAAAVMGKLEKRSFAHYALPFRGAFGRRFWEGIVWGSASLSVLVVVMWLGHGFAFRGFLLSGRQVIYFGGLWALAFLAVGFFEEFLMRGYALFTLTTGLGFWPSAVVLSIFFGAGHLGNSGESWVGALGAGLIGMFFCLTVRRTGSLWFAIGFHAAWDYAESFVYSVPDSGVMIPGRLMDSSFSGPRWLTGGNVGPEASVFAFVLIAVLWVIFARFNPSARFPGPSAETAALRT